MLNCLYIHVYHKHIGRWDIKLSAARHVVQWLSNCLDCMYLSPVYSHLVYSQYCKQTKCLKVILKEPPVHQRTSLSGYVNSKLELSVLNHHTNNNYINSEENVISSTVLSYHQGSKERIKRLAKVDLSFLYSGTKRRVLRFKKSKQ